VGWKTVFGTMLKAAGLALCGEAGQIFIHFRSPSSTDVLMNTFGAFAGAFLGYRQVIR
jgi:VanZ family protein